MSKKDRKKKVAKKRMQPLPGVELEQVVLQLQTLMGPEATAEHDQKIKDRLGHVR